MVLQTTLSSGPDRDVRGWHESSALTPSAARADAIDTRLRARLLDSFCHIADCVSLGDDGPANLKLLDSRLRGLSISPWVFCLYSKLVAEISKGDVGTSTVADIVDAASLPVGAAVVVPFRDCTVPAAWWDHFVVLFDTDSERDFAPDIPDPEIFSLCQREVEEGLSLLRLADPPWHDEVRNLLPMVFAGSGTLDTPDMFNGASTFFFWGGSLINAEVRRSAVSIIDLLIHESSHLLLFGLSADGALLSNSGEERYSSPLRADPRPIDGILHACFVASRVHLAMSRLLDSGYLTKDNEKRAADRLDHNAKSARIALEVLNKHARPTELGESVLGSLRSYWTAAALQ
jgi:HEXXH motif-containing protein